MGSSRKRQSSTSSSSSDSATSTSPSPTKSRSKNEKTPPSRTRKNDRNQSPRRQSFNNNNTSYTNNTSSNNRASHNKSMNTPTKYVGGDRAGLEPYLIERKRRKEEREAENDNKDKEEKKSQEKKEKDRKMKPDKTEKAEEEKDLQAPNFEKSGKLAEDRNTYKGIVIKYSEPTEARIPKTKWRLYPFKGEETLPTMYIHRNSGYLIGRERKVVDIPADHPSCSSQHAVIQFRLVEHTRADGSHTKKVKPYVMDLESTNGSFLNNVKIEARRYYELKERDIVKFGFSTREYVLLHERSEGVMDTES